MKIYKAEQIAEILQLDVITIYRYIKSGKLGSFTVGREYRITETDLQNYMDENRNVKGVN